jgi:hypothetical protein
VFEQRLIEEVGCALGLAFKQLREGQKIVG